MNKMLLLLGVFLFGGCVSPQMEKVDSTVESVVVGQESHAGISDTFFSNETISGNEFVGATYIFGAASKIELTVAGATNEKLTLNYSEYTKPPVDEYGAFTKDSNWIIKSGFNSQFQYDLTTSKTVTFKGYEFQVLDVKDNIVTYKRTK